MEKRFTLALLLSLAVLFIWQFYFSPSIPPEQGKKEAAPSKQATPDHSHEKPQPAPGQKVKRPPPPPSFEEQHYLLQNKVLRLELSNRGGVVTRAWLLKRYPDAATRKQDGPRLELLGNYGAGSEGRPVHALTLRLNDSKGAHLDDGEWQVEEDKEHKRIIFTRRVKRGKQGGFTLLVKKILSLADEEASRLHFSLEYSYIGPQKLTWGEEFTLFTSGGVWQENAAAAMGSAGTFVFPSDGKQDSGNKVVFAKVKDKPEGLREVMGGKLRYLCDTSSYFGAFMALLEGFPGGTQSVVYPLAPGKELEAAAKEARGSVEARTYSACDFNLALTAGQKPLRQEGLLYLGSFKIAEDAPGLARARPLLTKVFDKVRDDRLGLVSGIAKFILTVLGWLHGVCGSWGWSILMLTFLVRALLFPVNRRSQGAMLHHGEQMARIKPQIQALKKKYEKEPRKFAEAQMKLMKKEGVSMVPLGGCLPTLLQIPIFFGLFSALRASIDLRQSSWLWVADLSKPDNLITFSHPVWNPMSLCSFCCQVKQPPITGLHLLPILMTVAWFLNSYLMPRPTTADPQMEQQRKLMMFTPIIFGFMMYNYAAGLSIYWLTSSTLGIIETKVIKKYLPVKIKPKKRRRPARG